MNQKTNAELIAEKVERVTAALVEQLKYTSPKFPDFDVLSARCLARLGSVDQCTEQATQIAEQLHAAEYVVTDLDSQLATLSGLVAEGKACLRSGEPVRPECGMAPSVIPEVEAELVIARQRVDTLKTELNSITQKRNNLELQNEQELHSATTAVRLADIEKLIHTAMQRAAELSLELGYNEISTAVRIDNRINVLLRAGGQIANLRGYQGEKI